MYAIQASQHRPWCIQLSGTGDHRLVITLAQLFLFQRRAVNTDTESLAENQLVTWSSAGIALEMFRVNQANRHQAVDRLDRINSVPAGNRDAGRPTDRFATGQNFRNGFQRQNIDRHANQRQGKEWRATHRINIRNGVGCGNSPKIKGVIDNRHEKIRRRDNRLLCIDLINRRIVAGFSTNQQLWRNNAGGHAGQNFLQYGRGNLAATTTTMGKLGKSDFFF